VYARPNPQPLIVSATERVVLLGSNNPFSESSIIALDGKTGSVLWQSDAQNGQSMIANQLEIIVGGIGEVFAFDGVNGKILWSTALPASRSVTNMYAMDNDILVDTVSSRYFVLNKSSGEIIQIVDYDTSNLPYWRNIPYGAYWQAPVYNNHYLYGRTGQRYGYAFAIDLDNSSELWRTDENIISNVSVTSSHAYVLSEDGKLIEIALNTGQQKVIVEFDAAPFKIMSTPSGGYMYSYYVAVDSNEQIIYVLLGDSAQLFAFTLPS
jgi:outer membrane protein assembly factor BamB